MIVDRRRKWVPIQLTLRRKASTEQIYLTDG
ncbi:Uncharacterised protein [Vibrio cholerae]|nr:Uncharacterised protein [Vibrio cholerae]